MAEAPQRWFQIGEELVVVWNDGTESYIRMTTFRQACPCAQCGGEPDILGRVLRPPQKPLVDDSFRLVRIDPVGTYALQPFWADGHSTGIYGYALLRRLGEAAGGAARS